MASGSQHSPSYFAYPIRAAGGIAMDVLLFWLLMHVNGYLAAVAIPL